MPAMDDFDYHRDRAAGLLAAIDDAHLMDPALGPMLAKAQLHAQLATAAAALVQAEEVAQLRELLDSRFAELSSGIEDATEAIAGLAGAVDRTGAAIDGQETP